MKDHHPLVAEGMKHLRDAILVCVLVGSGILWVAIL